MKLVVGWGDYFCCLSIHPSQKIMKDGFGVHIPTIRSLSMIHGPQHHMVSTHIFLGSGVWLEWRHTNHSHISLQNQSHGFIANALKQLIRDETLIRDKTFRSWQQDTCEANYASDITSRASAKSILHQAKHHFL